MSRYRSLSRFDRSIYATARISGAAIAVWVLSVFNAMVPPKQPPALEAAWLICDGGSQEEGSPACTDLQL